uniref:RNA1 polyprotein n=1 Tax=Grapevine fanleaf virus TaxID=12274 RepID=A0A1J0MMB1_GFLV|nr:polyprotein P1 [Grapevine fanleaf virus]
MWQVPEGSQCCCTGKSFSNAEAKELRYVCSCWMSTRLIKAEAPPQQTRKSRIAPAPLKSKETVQVSFPNVVGIKPNNPKSKGTSVVPAPLLKQRCEVVVQYGPPADIELVYPPLVREEEKSSKRKVLPPTKKVEVRVPACCAPKWMVAIPKPPIKLAPRVSKLRFPKGAVAYNGVNFIDSRGKVVLSEGAKRILKGIRVATKQRLRAARRSAACKRVRAARALAQFEAIAQTERLDQLRTGFQVVLPAPKMSCNSKGVAPSTATKAVVKKRKLIKLPKAMPEQDFSCLEDFDWGEKSHSIEVDIEDDWVLVEKPAVTRQAAQSVQGRATEALTRFAATSGFSLDAHRKVEEFASLGEAERLMAGEFVDLCLKSLVYNDAPILSTTIEELTGKEDFQNAIELLKLELGELPANSTTCAPFKQWASASKQMAKGVGTMVGNFVRAAGAAAVISFDIAVEFLQDKALKFCKKIFDVTMAPYLQHLASAHSIVKKIWEKLSEWMESLKSKASLALEVMAQHAIFALGAMVIGGVVVLVEKVLVAAKIIPNCGVILGAFLTLFFASLGLTALECTAEEIFRMHACCKSAIYSMYSVSEPTVVGEGESVVMGATQGLDNAIQALTRVGQSMISFKLGSFSYYAKIAQGFDQLARGKRAIGELTSWLIDLVGSIYSQVSGQESTFFDELSTIVCLDVRAWLLRSKRVRLQVETMAIGDRITLNTISKLLEEGHKILVTAAGVPRKTSADFTMCIKEEVSKLEEVHARTACAGVNEGMRAFPFWVYITGASQSGKTTIANSIIIPALLEEMNLPKSSVYSRPKTGGFWSGYARQACVKIDDFYAIEQTPSLASSMIDVVNSEPYPLDMAYLHEKGMSMDSPLVVTTANTAVPPTNSQVVDLPSFYNRRAAVLEVRRKDGSCFTPSDYDSCIEVRFLHSKCPYVDSAGVPQGPAVNTPMEEGWITPSEAVMVLKNLLGVHVLAEEEKLLEYRERIGNDHPIYNAAKEFIGNMHYPGQWLTTEQKNTYGIKDDGFSFLAVDGKMYKYNVLGKLNPCESVPPHPNVIPWLEKKTLEIVHWDVHKHIATGPRNALVACFLQGLVQGQSKVESVERMGQDSSPEQQAFFKRLSLSERIYLRLCQIRIDGIQNEELAGMGRGPMVILRECLLKSKQAVVENYSLLLTLVAILLLISAAYTLLSTVVALAGCSSFAGGMLAVTAVNNASIPCSEPRMEERYSPRNRFVSRISKIRGEGPSMGQGEHEELVTELYYFSDGVKKLISTCWFKGRSLLMTRHQALAVPIGNEVEIIYADGTSRKLVWPGRQEDGNCKGFIEFPENELVVFEHPRLLTLPIKYEKFFVDDADRQISPNVAVKCCVARLDDGIPQFHFWNKYATARSEVHTLKDEGGGDVYQNKIRRYIVYAHEAKKYDCGALAVAVIQGVPKVIAMLVSVDRNITISSVIPNYSSSFVRGDVPYVPEDGITTNGYRKVGYLHRPDAPHVPTKTAFMRVPDELCFPYPNPKQPAILSAEDERLKGTIHEGYEPVKDGMKKFAEPMGLLDEKLLDEVAGDMVHTWYDPGEFLEDISLDLAINGDDNEEYFDPLVMDTSEGYPDVLERKPGEKGKARFFVGEPGNRVFVAGCKPERAYYQLEEDSKTKVPSLVSIETPKDERLKKSKIDTPGTRLFSVLPLAYNLLLRVKFLSFSRLLMKKRGHLPCQVGINPYSREWTDIYHRLGELSDVGYNCDYKAFDGLITEQVLSVIADMINAGYRDPIGNRQRKNLLLAISGRLSICGNQVYVTEAGIPSGCALTVILNSIFNELLMRYCFKKIVPPLYKECFDRCVVLITYGDDNVFTVAQSVMGYFTGDALKRQMAMLGVTITDGKDKSLSTIPARPLLELEFLKRGFYKGLGGQIYAPLEKLSIMSSLVYIRSDGSDLLQKLLDNVNTALVELYLHGDREYYESVMAFYMEKLPPGAYKQLTTWHQAESFHECQKSGESGYKPQGLIEVSHGAAFAGFVRQSGTELEKHDICPGLAVAGAKYIAAENEIILSLSSMLPGDVNASKLELPCGDGIGRLPSKTSILALRKPGLVTKLCHRAQLERKTLVIRDERPYIGAWAVACICGESFGFGLQSVLTLYANLLGPNQKNGLASYFSDFDNPIHIKKIHAATNSVEGSDALREVFTFCETKLYEATDVDVRKAVHLNQPNAYPSVSLVGGISFPVEGKEPGAMFSKADVERISQTPGVYVSEACLKCCLRCPGVVTKTVSSTHTFGSTFLKTHLKTLRRLQTHTCRRR